MNTQTCTCIGENTLCMACLLVANFQFLRFERHETEKRTDDAVRQVYREKFENSHIELSSHKM